MASQSSERPVAHMAAVCDIFSFDSTLDPEKRALFLPPHSPRSTERSAQVSASRKKAPQQYLPLREITLPEVSTTSPSTLSEPYRSRPLSSLDGIMGLHRLPDHPSNKACTLDDWNEYLDWCSTKSASQAHLQRSSPPLQPGEQNFPGKLPSFDEFVQTTIERTPPHTPSRRNESTESSPHVRPQFDDVAWTDSKRRRVDTLGDIYARQSNASEYPPADRRMSSAIDPALYPADSTRSRQHSAGPSHHRPSLPFPSSTSAPQHARHQSQPVAQGHALYQQPPIPAPRMVVQGSYAQPAPPPPGMMYERRESYYQDPRMQQHAYPYDDRRESVYYANQAYGAQAPVGYEQGYYDVRFQQHVGVDHNAFNRKRRGNLPKEATNILKDWFAANRASPYPSEDQKMELCALTQLSLNQVSNWFINARRRAPQKEQRERENANAEQ